MKGPQPREWDRQPTETGAEYKKFRVYLEMGRVERSIRGSYRVVTGKNKDKDAPGSWYELAEKHAWNDRARSHDAANDKQDEAALRARRLKSLIEAADLGDSLRKKAAAAVRMLTPVTQRLGERDGKEVWILEVNMTPSDICKLAQVGVALESLALGLPTDRTSLQDGGPDQTAISLDEAKGEMKRRLDAIRQRHELAAPAVEEALGRGGNNGS